MRIKNKNIHLIAISIDIAIVFLLFSFTICYFKDINLLTYWYHLFVNKVEWKGRVSDIPQECIPSKKYKYLIFSCFDTITITIGPELSNQQLATYKKSTKKLIYLYHLKTLINNKKVLIINYKEKQKEENELYSVFVFENLRDIFFISYNYSDDDKVFDLMKILSK